MDIWLAKT